MTPSRAEQTTNTTERDNTTPDQPAGPVVYILDCDNTLLDNDAMKTDMDRELHDILGDALADRYWAIYEEVRASTGGTVDLPETFARLRPELPDDATYERAYAAVMDYPFATRLYPAARTVLRRLTSVGLPVIVSDGDQVYQPRKIERSGLAAAVHGQVAIYSHKQDHLDEIQARWPASYYVMVDDKARILADVKRLAPNRFVTIHIVQGHYAGDTSFDPKPDLTLDSIGDLLTVDLAGLARYLG